MPDILWRGCAAVLRSVLKAVFTIKWRIWTGRCCASQHTSEDPGISVWLQRHHPQCPHGNQTCRGCLREKTQLSKCLKANETTKGQFLLPTLFPSSYPSSQWLWTIKDGPSGGACHLYGAEVRERLCVLKRTLYIDSYNLSWDGMERESLLPSFDWRRRSVSFLVSVWALKDCLDGQIASTDALSPNARFLTSSSFHLRSWGWGLGPSVC